MDCPDVEELLPWLLNRTLSAEEAAAVRAHLVACVRCRQAFAETRWMAGLADAHLAAEQMADLAARVPLAVEDRASVEAHLAACEECAAELALMRESWVGMDEIDSATNGVPAAPSAESRVLRPSFGRRAPAAFGGWRSAAAAALVAGVALSIHGVWQWRRAADLRSVTEAERSVDGARTERLVRELATAQAARDAAEARLAVLDAPQLNAAVVELLPEEMVLRSTKGAPAVLPRPAAGRITLMLYPPPLAAGLEGPLRVELRDLHGASGRLLWSASGLEQQSAGGFSLALPVELLGEEAVVLRLFPASEGARALATYRFRLRRPEGALTAPRR